MELYMFRIVPMSIVRSLVLYTQQHVYVVQVMLTACEQDQDGAELLAYHQADF